MSSRRAVCEMPTNVSLLPPSGPPIASLLAGSRPHAYIFDIHNIIVGRIGDFRGKSHVLPALREASAAINLFAGCVSPAFHAERERTGCGGGKRVHRERDDRRPAGGARRRENPTSRARCPVT